MQYPLVEYAQGARTGSRIFCGNDDTCRRLCHSQVGDISRVEKPWLISIKQRVRMRSHSSFTFWILILILVGGGLIMILSFQEQIITAVSHLARLRRNNKFIYAHAEWEKAQHFNSSNSHTRIYAWVLGRKREKPYLSPNVVTCLGCLMSGNINMLDWSPPNKSWRILTKTKNSQSWIRKFRI